MRIMLINPPITSAERYGKDIGSIGGHQAPLGLCYLAAVLERDGHEVALIDAEADNLKNEDIIKKIKDFNPFAIGITSTTVAFHRALGLAKDIKSFNPGIPVIIGGPHVTANPQRTMAFECFDYAVLREGEHTLPELIRTLQDGTSVDSVKGIIYRKNGDIVLTAPRPYIEDMDSLPLPARHLLHDIKRYAPPLGSYLKGPVINIITSRGCPYRCIFCDNNVFGRRIRYHSPERVVSEIENAIKLYGAREIAFLDDTFTVDSKRMRKIISLIKEKGLDIKWTCMTRVDNVTKELLQEMKGAGCWQVSVGVESGDQAVLDFIKKGIKLEQVEGAVKLCRETGIYVKGFFMLGHPTDTAETINRTIEFAKSLPFDDVVIAIATPISGTDLYSIANKYGSFQDKDWSRFSYWSPVFVPHGLSEELLYKKRRQFYSEFYLRQKVILRQMRKIRNFQQLFKYAVTVPKAVLFR